MLIWVYTCQNVKLLEISYRGSFANSFDPDQLDLIWILTIWHFVNVPARPRVHEIFFMKSLNLKKKSADDKIIGKIHSMWSFRVNSIQFQLMKKISAYYSRNTHKTNNAEYFLNFSV